MGAGKRGGNAVKAFTEFSPNSFSRVVSLAALTALICASPLAITGVAAQAASTPGPVQGQSGHAAGSTSQSKPKSVAIVPWKRVPDAQKKVLAPLEAEWPTLQGTQQRKLLGAAKHYPSLTPVEQERFQERLRSWSTLTPEQRSAARDQFQLLSNLPKEKQAALTSRWQQEKQAEKAAKESPAPAPATK